MRRAIGLDDIGGEGKKEGYHCPGPEQQISGQVMARGDSLPQVAEARITGCGEPHQGLPVAGDCLGAPRLPNDEFTDEGSQAIPHWISISSIFSSSWK